VVIDLHAHSDVSDGTESPSQLVATAAGLGVHVLALADHDTTAGWGQAHQAGAVRGVEVVPAIEVSTAWRGADVHLLAYWPDDQDAALQQMLRTIREGRRLRVPRMLAGLAAHGVVLTEHDVRRAAGDAVSVGRPHVADALVAAGVVDSREHAFATLIGEGMPGHVPKPAPPLPTAIRTVVDAGGVPVLAHPWARGTRRVLDEAALVELAESGLVGVEVDHVDHTAAVRAELRALADSLGLVVTGGSDYHGAGKPGVLPGMNRTTPQAYEALRAHRDQRS
jgi:predicted metal-dependent phosphoesterase TrpH